MRPYRYIGEIGRYYPERGLEAEPGSVADWDEPPDPYWQLAESSDAFDHNDLSASVAESAFVTVTPAEGVEV